MKKFTFLHLSDLHLHNQSSHDQKVVLEALFADIKTIVKGGKKIDAIFFTGDLVAKGKYDKNTPSFVRDTFITPLLAAAEIGGDKLFITPGNHDVDISRADPFIEGAYDRFASHMDVNSFIDTISDREFYFPQLSNFNQTLPQYSPPRTTLQNVLFRSYSFEVNGTRVGVACVNSAWRASGRPKDEDYGRLLVGERQVEILHNSIAEADLKLALIHHPLDWLTTYDKTAVQRAIYKKFDALLHGHNHTAEAISLATSANNIFISNAGCLYQSREYFNGYSVLDVTLGQGQTDWTVWVREYYEGRGEFDDCTRFAPGGIKSYVVGKDSLSVSLLPSTQYVDSVQEKLNSQLLSYAASDIAPKTVHGIFVEPPLSHLSEKHFNAEKGNNADVQYLTLHEKVLEEKHILFMGGRESGKTTLLSYLCTKATDPLYFPNATLAVYVDLMALPRKTKAAVLDAAVHFCGGEYKRSEITSLAESGRIVFCFDNLSLEKYDTVTLVKEFVKDYAKCRFYFTAEERIEHALEEDEAKVLGFECKVVYIHAFTRKQTRELVNKWFPDTPEILQEKVDSIISSIRKLGVPRTPFLISVLLWIKERNISFTPVNHAAIIDAFIDGLLEKLTESKDRSNTDSTIKRHYLAELAYAVHKSGKERWTQHELEKFTVDYFEHKALRSSTLPFLQELFDKGILINLGEDVCFKFDCFRAFFLAHKMNETEELRQYALTRTGFLRLGNEIDYYTGLYRNRLDFLTRSLQIVEEFRESLSFKLDLSLFDKINVEQSILSHEDKEAIKENLFGKRLSIQEQEAIFDDAEIASEIAPPVRTRESDLSDAQARSLRGKAPLIEYFEALRIASAVLRNSELVDDANLKHTIYDKLISMWSEVLLSILLTVENADERREHELGELLPSAPRVAIKYFAKLVLPNLVFMMLKDSLGTAKLELIIDDHMKDERLQIKDLMSTFLYVDLNLPQKLEKLKNLLDRFPTQNRYLIELVFFKLLELYLFKNASESDVTRIKELVADVFVKLNDSGTKRMNDIQKSQFISDLERKSYQSRIGVKGGRQKGRKKK